MESSLDGGLDLRPRITKMVGVVRARRTAGSEAKGEIEEIWIVVMGCLWWNIAMWIDSGEESVKVNVGRL